MKKLMLCIAVLLSTGCAVGLTHQPGYVPYIGEEILIGNTIASYTTIPIKANVKPYSTEVELSTMYGDSVVTIPMSIKAHAVVQQRDGMARVKYTNIVQRIGNGGYILVSRTPENGYGFNVIADGILSELDKHARAILSVSSISDENDGWK